MPSGTFYSFTTPLGVGVTLYNNPLRRPQDIVPDGTYSNGNQCYTIDGGNGVITAVSTCPSPSPTPTSTVTPTLTKTQTPTPTPTPTKTPAGIPNLNFYAVEEYFCLSIPGVCATTGQTYCVASTTVATPGNFYRNTHPDGQGEILFVTNVIDPGVCLVVTLEMETNDCNVLCGTIT